MTEFKYDDKASFMTKLEELLKKGYTSRQLQMYLPHPDHDIEHLVEHYWKPSKLKYFTLVGGLTGCLTGYLFTTFTAYDWVLITGGKPLFSAAPYTVIAFELTILLGALASFAGIMILGRLPKISKMIERPHYGNQFVILIDEKEK